MDDLADVVDPFLIFDSVTKPEVVSYNSFVTEINYVADCVLALWEGPQLLRAKVKDADGQDWYILSSVCSGESQGGTPLARC